MGWSVIARMTSFGLALIAAMLPVMLPLAVLPVARAQADSTVTAASGTKASGSDAGADNPGSDDGDSGVNDDPVWGYFLGKTAYVFFHEIGSAMKTQDGETPIANTAAKRDQLAARSAGGLAQERASQACPRNVLDGVRRRDDDDQGRVCGAQGRRSAEQQQADQRGQAGDDKSAIGVGDLHRSSERPGQLRRQLFD